MMINPLSNQNAASDKFDNLIETFKQKSFYHQPFPRITIDRFNRREAKLGDRLLQVVQIGDYLTSKEATVPRCFLQISHIRGRTVTLTKFNKCEWYKVMEGYTHEEYPATMLDSRLVNKREKQHLDELPSYVMSGVK